MNRDIKSAAAVLGLRDRELRAHLREKGLLTQDGQLIISPRTQGRLFADTRSRWNAAIGAYTHYAVVMVTERGIAWLAQSLGKPITTIQHKDRA